MLTAPFKNLKDRKFQKKIKKPLDKRKKMCYNKGTKEKKKGIIAITKKEMFDFIATLNSDNQEVVEFCKHEIELLENRKTSKSPTKTQKANEVLMERIAEVLANYPDGVTVSNLIRENEEFAEYRGQKMSALLNKMANAKTVNKVIDKRTTLFVLA